jgi:hypothetical protein
MAERHPSARQARPLREGEATGMSGFKERETKISETDRAARQIIDAEKMKHDAKMARLRAAREAAEVAAPATPPERPKKGKRQ